MDTKDMMTIIATVFSFGAVYGLIRADLKHLHERILMQKSEMDRIEKLAERAHVRLDDHIIDYHRKQQS